MHSPRLLAGYVPGVLRPRPLYFNKAAIDAHHHVLGKTGQGKSIFLAHCYVELVKLGYGVSLIDPHRDLANQVLALLHDVGLADDRLLFIDFGQRERFVPFNVLSQPYPRDKVARIIVEACKRVWPALANGAAPMFENVMLAACITLIANDLPFTAFPSLINDKRYRHELLEKVDDPLVKQYFETFDKLPVKDQIDQSQSSMRRVFNLLLSEELRYTVGQTANALPFREIMDEGRLAIYDLSSMDKETRSFIGALIAQGYEEAALSRSDIPERMRRPHHLIMDEFASFSSASEAGLATILSEARKYKLTLWLAHQTWGQLSEKVENALQNTARAAFAVGVRDARIIAPSFTQYDPLAIKYLPVDGDRSAVSFYGVQDTFEKMATELQNLKPRQVMLRYPATRRHRLIFHKPAIKIDTIKTPTVQTKATEEEIKALRERYARKYLRPRSDVVAEVTALLERTASASKAPTLRRKGSIFE